MGCTPSGKDRKKHMANALKDIDFHLTELVRQALLGLGAQQPEPALVPPPRAEMGYLGLACFPWAKELRKPPVAIAADLHERLTQATAHDPLIEEVHVEGPFLNFRLHQPQVLKLLLDEIGRDQGHLCGDFVSPEADQKILVEYSSPNTNKPQHLGHVRNNLLGQVVSNIMEHYGYQVIRTNLINDRGIHICKSMLAYQRFGEGVTPESAGIKGDHLIGDFYVKFNSAFSAEYKAWLGSEAADEAFAAWKASPASRKPVQGWQKAHRKKGEPAPEPDEATLRGLFEANYKDIYFNTASEMGAATSELLRRWEAGDDEVRALWKTLNGWVEAGFWQTYQRMGIHFDHVDHESETYLLGKDLVQEGLEAGVFEKADNGATVFNLEKIGLQGQKAVLRPDGTSLYTTQDLGTAVRRYEQYKPQQMVYVVGDEQNHHFKVLFGILGTLRPELQGQCHHLSYGMVNLPHGRMKSREGTVVDADDLMNEVHSLAEEATRAIYKDEALEEAELHHRAEIIGLAALKYFLMDHTPQTTMTFNPEASLELTGRTGVYALYSYARTAGILSKGEFQVGEASVQDLAPLTHEKALEIIGVLASFPQVIKRSFDLYDPSKITEYVWKLGKTFSSFYEHCPVLQAETPELRQARLYLVYAVNQVQKQALALLGITALERM